ncbi:MAG TPA: D-alanyl-D-alanine carboxypeptidase [Pseudonocardiaceae bacterium]|nr:D-alanyl-D-alanine carboxypeptidase [Pseudonocardiaceae bacterium]
MTDRRCLPDSRRDRIMAAGALALGGLLLPIAFLRSPGRAKYFASQWALAARFPRENLAGLDRATRAAFTRARAEAFWRDHQLIGLTSGHREAGAQQRMFEAEVRRTGSEHAARLRVLPPAESSHVRGVALDVRPWQGARWLEHNGGRYSLFRHYDNEWWHFEHRADGRAPEMLPHPGATPIGSISGSLLQPARIDMPVPIIALTAAGWTTNGVL